MHLRAKTWRDKEARLQKEITAKYTIAEAFQMRRCVNWTVHVVNNRCRFIIDIGIKNNNNNNNNAASNLLQLIVVYETS
jgi:hypothetical protein